MSDAMKLENGNQEKSFQLKLNKIRNIVFYLNTRLMVNTFNKF